ncbi:uncharacterized protein LOC112099547 [Citrus clementina]|uniref:uncharacterized protein LOC112099547 n=1 Tax=Citrus clementina TaxID=85681 RepID=UPI000CED718A|nr:uncharacterized protein LOC112099547 [Citrus x clementina]
MDNLGMMPVSTISPITLLIELDVKDMVSEDLNKNQFLEERLDRVLASAEWLHRFARVKVMSLEASCSDHLPIFMDLNPINTTSRHKRFRFENLWLRERDCVEVITNSWNSSSGCSIQQKISRCGADLFQ